MPSTISYKWPYKNVVKCHERPFETCVPDVKQEKLVLSSTSYFVLASSVFLQIGLK
jgi:hypothetical protein